jgi:cell wall-associated NlpC family hydrolase
VKEEYIDEMINYLKSFLGLPYKWGGKKVQDGGLDCSGLVLEGLRSIRMWGKSEAYSRQIFTELVTKLKMVDDVSKGCILFFGKSRTEIIHVSIAINDFQMIEAGGNDQDGSVRIRPVLWRKDLIAILKI